MQGQRPSSTSRPCPPHGTTLSVCTFMQKSECLMPGHPFATKTFLRRVFSVPSITCKSSTPDSSCRKGHRRSNLPAMLVVKSLVSFLQDIRNSVLRSRAALLGWWNPSSISAKISCSKPSHFHFRFRAIYFLRNEQPSVSLALPPVGWQSTVEQPAQITTVWACEKTVVMVKQPGHLTSMKNDRGVGTRVLSLCLRASA